MTATELDPGREFRLVLRPRLDSLRMPADTSFLARVYTAHADSAKALKWMQQARDPLPFTPLHRLELRNAIRLRMFRREIAGEQRQQAFEEIDSDLNGDILVHAPIPWTDAFRAAEALEAAHTEILGVRSFDLLHVGLPVVLRAKEFLTFDSRQAELAKAAGLKLKL